MIEAYITFVVIYLLFMGWNAGQALARMVTQWWSDLGQRRVHLIVTVNAGAFDRLRGAVTTFNVLRRVQAWVRAWRERRKAMREFDDSPSEAGFGRFGAPFDCGTVSADWLLARRQRQRIEYHGQSIAWPIRKQ